MRIEGIPVWTSMGIEDRIILVIFANVVPGQALQILEARWISNARPSVFAEEYVICYK